MPILDRSVGHPATWSDVGLACDRLQDEYIINLDIRLYFSMPVGLKPMVQIVVEAVPTAWSPHAGRKPVTKHRHWELSGNRPLSEGIYGLLWEVDSTVGIVWPIAHVEGK